MPRFSRGRNFAYVQQLGWWAFCVALWSPGNCYKTNVTLSLISFLFVSFVLVPINHQHCQVFKFEQHFFQIEASVCRETVCGRAITIGGAVSCPRLVWRVPLVWPWGQTSVRKHVKIRPTTATITRILIISIIGGAVTVEALLMTGALCVLHVNF